MPDFDHVDALRQSPPERALDDTITVGRAAHLSGAEGNLIEVDILILVN